MIEIVFIAQPSKRVLQVYPAYESFFPRFYAALSAFHPVTVLDLPDIWVRDFLPVQHVQTGQLYQPFFKPNYANYTPRFTRLIRARVREIFPAEPCAVRIDGGNIIWGPGGAVFCLPNRRIFRRSRLGEQKEAESNLLQALGAEKMVWLPREIGDKVGHIDGFMQFIGDTLFVSREDFDPYLKKLMQRRLETVRRECPDLKICFLPCVPDSEDPSGLSARGVYVNFLATSQAVFVPQYGLPQDTEALQRVQTAVSQPVIGVDCSEISKYGGALHCLTQVYLAEGSFSAQSISFGRFSQ